ncbi:MAG: pyridoxal-phosphate dependent enzyme [Anaerolineaceae bacterium]|nr:pyridoxal-phosphate dependent enzyme [Anaerolineaceae bacterium]
MIIANSILDVIGNTPPICLNRADEETRGGILVKAESLNPNSNIKDCIAKCMVEAAEEEGKLKEGYTIAEAATGNTDTALSLVAAVKG